MYKKYIPRRRPVNCKKVPKNSIALSSNFSTIKSKGGERKVWHIENWIFFKRKKIRKDICTTGPSFNFVFLDKIIHKYSSFRFIQIQRKNNTKKIQDFFLRKKNYKLSTSQASRFWSSGSGNSHWGKVSFFVNKFK